MNPPVIAPLMGRTDITPITHTAEFVSRVITIAIGCSSPQGENLRQVAKHFKSDGSKEVKRAHYFKCTQIYVPKAEDLVAVLRLVGSNSHAAVLAVGFPDEPIFQLAHSPTDDCFEYLFANGFLLDATGNAPEGALTAKHIHTEPSAWLALDFDPDQTTPPEYRSMTVVQTLDLLDPIVPGIASAPRVSLPSSSGRVCMNGVSGGVGRCHVWVLTAGMETWSQRKDAAKAVRQQLVTKELAWSVPNKIGRMQVRVPTDLSTWTGPGWIYCGKPTVEKGCGLVVAPMSLVLENSIAPPVVMSHLQLPDQRAWQAAERNFRPGVSIYVSSTERGMLDIFDLIPELEVELGDGSIFTLDKVKKLLLDRFWKGENAPKVRMQTPLRPGSRSTAAFASLTSSNELFLCDSGLPGEVHHFERIAREEFTGAISDATSSQPRVHPLLRFVEAPVEPRVPRWVIPGFMAEGVVTIAGAQGLGKTTALLPLALMAAGIHADETPLAPKHWRHVIYVTEDDDQAQRILSGLVGHSDFKPSTQLVNERFHLVPAKRLPVDQIVEVGPDYRGRFARWVEGVEVLPLVVFDTKSAIIDSDDENANAEASKTIARLKQEFAGLPLWIIGHISKGTTSTKDLTALSMRGGGAFEADANQVLFLVKDIQGRRYLIRGKTRFEAFWVALEFDTRTASIFANDQWGVAEMLTLRWSEAKPMVGRLEDIKLKAGTGSSTDRLTDVAEEVMASVRDAHKQGLKPNKTMVANTVGKRKSDTKIAIDNLLESGQLLEKDVPQQERKNSNQKKYLVAIEDD